MASRYSSRLSRRSEKQSKKTVVWSLVGIVIVLIIFFKLILPLLFNASSVISKDKDTGTTKSNSPSFVAPPFLNQTFDATNSASVSISGTALPKETVKLFVNGNEVSSNPTKDDGSFSFDSITLNSGQNTIQAKAQNQNNNESDFSNQLTISYSILCYIPILFFRFLVEKKLLFNSIVVLDRSI